MPREPTALLSSVPWGHLALLDGQAPELFTSVAGKPAFASLSAEGLGILTGPSAVVGAS